jgi:thiol-disulfide isomerase/thioredoxin
MSFKIKSAVIALILISVCFIAVGPEFFTKTSCTVCSGMNPILNQVAEAQEKKPEEKKDLKKTITAYYFHGDFRCDSCKKIEQYSREAIEKYFADQLKTGELVFKVINMDRPENQHFIQDYQLYTRSLVIAEFKGTTQVRWKNLAEVWNNLDDQEAFYYYVKTEIQKYMEST